MYRMSSTQNNKSVTLYGKIRGGKALEMEIKWNLVSIPIIYIFLLFLFCFCEKNYQEVFLKKKPLR